MTIVHAEGIDPLEFDGVVPMASAIANAVRSWLDEQQVSEIALWEAQAHTPWMRYRAGTAEIRVWRDAPPKGGVLNGIWRNGVWRITKARQLRLVIKGHAYEATLHPAPPAGARPAADATRPAALNEALRALATDAVAASHAAASGGGAGELAEDARRAARLIAVESALTPALAIGFLKGVEDLIANGLSGCPHDGLSVGSAIADAWWEGESLIIPCLRLRPAPSSLDAGFIAWLAASDDRRAVTLYWALMDAARRCEASAVFGQTALQGLDPRQLALRLRVR